MTPPSVFFHDFVPLLKIKISEGKEILSACPVKAPNVFFFSPYKCYVIIYLLLCNIYSKKEMGRNKLK